MKKINIVFSFILLLSVTISCTKDSLDTDTSSLSTVNSGNYDKIFDISNNNSGLVKITPLGQGATSFNVIYGHGTGSGSSAIVSPGYNTTHNYPEGVYTVSIISSDIAGVSNTSTYPLTVTYRAPENLAILISSDMKVSATALYAKSFLVYYGDVIGEIGTPMSATIDSTTGLATGVQLPSHIYPSGGPYDLKVVALSGGIATTQSIKTLFGFPLSFESPTMDYFFGTFGNVNFSKVANPNTTGNISATVGKYEKPIGAETWSGTYSPLNIPLNFAYGNKVKIMVYNPDSANIGKMINVELESQIAGTGATANGIGIKKVAITTSGAWEELIFDFSTIPAIGPAARYEQLILRFNDIAAGAGEIIYVDNIRLTF